MPRPSSGAGSTAAPVLAKYREIMTWVNAGPYKDAAKAEFADGADGWLIAYAQIESLVLVTHERFAPDVKRIVPMPNVCQQFAVSSAHTFDMLRDLEVSFEWTPP
jgi:hypothetical protein